MTTFVIKKDGSKQPFDPQKLRTSIQKAVKQAGIEKERGLEIVREILKDVLNFVRSEEEIQTKKLRDRILDNLEEMEPTVDQAWRSYEQTK